MKSYIIVLLLLVVVQGLGQRKKKEDPKDVLIDSLTKTNVMLSGQLDSLSKDQKLYYGLYTTIKEKVLLKDFDPAKLPVIIDSIRASRDSSTSLLAAPIASLKDSLAMISGENKTLKARVDSVTTALNTYITSSTDKTKLTAELKNLKDLLDSKVINQKEYEDKKKLVMDRWQ